MTLDTIPLGRRVRIVAVDSCALAADEAARLAALGIAAGASVQVEHRGVFGGGDPLAVRVGRMTVALRRAHAAAIAVEAA